MLGNADIALYEAKNAGRRTYRVFDEEMQKRAIFVRSTKADLNSALSSENGFVPYFQPQFSSKTLELVGFEVLARWEHPTRGVLVPDQFMGFAQELNCVAELDRQILSKSVQYVRDWEKLGLLVPRLSVNVSSERLQDPELLQCVEDLGASAPKLSFELLESTFLDNTNEQVTEALDHLRHLGVDFEIDDFGSGYASILSLINVRPNRLKIDRTLIQDVATNKDMTSLVKSVVDIARTFNIEVVAEGVETEEQISILVGIGCDILQGFGLAKPMAPDAVVERYLDHGCSTLLQVG